ncbi:MAG TPA: arginyltransferase [Methylococcus sp.]|nr:arginyltransferase [Methylococcus sp.]
MTTRKIPLWVSPEHACGYLPGSVARFGCVASQCDLSADRYQILLANGFRRSGNWVYRPLCRSCAACIPVRIPVTEFRETRAQRRILKKNADLEVTAVPVTFREEHLRLYRRYLSARHPDAAMCSTNRDDYRAFIGSQWAHTYLFEFRTNIDLVGVAVVDQVPEALSAVYTFFDPAAATRSPGVLAVLWQIREARRLGLKWVYLGYWIENCRKMVYKNQYRPLEALVGGVWRRFAKGETLVGGVL